jgi:hypothetical protein
MAHNNRKVNPPGPHSKTAYYSEKRLKRLLFEDIYQNCISKICKTKQFLGDENKKEETNKSLLCIVL